MAPTRAPLASLPCLLLLGAGLLVAANQPHAAPTVTLVAVGEPLGPEPEGWEDLRGVPFELHRLRVSPDPPHAPCVELPLELRPGGRVIHDFDGTRALPWMLYRDGTRDFNGLPVTYGSGSSGSAISPYRGWESYLPLWLRPPQGETSIREIVLEIDFVRLLEWKDAEGSIDARGHVEPRSLPMGDDLTARPTELILNVIDESAGDVSPRSPASPFSPLMDLWQGRDSRNRRVRWAGSMGGMVMTSLFKVYGMLDEPIAYPVAMRYRTPLKWSCRTYRFVLKDVPLIR